MERENCGREGHSGQRERGAAARAGERRAWTAVDPAIRARGVDPLGRSLTSPFLPSLTPTSSFIGCVAGHLSAEKR